jgi:hypothetical protein
LKVNVWALLCSNCWRLYMYCLSAYSYQFLYYMYTVHIPDLYTLICTWLYIYTHSYLQVLHTTNNRFDPSQVSTTHKSNPHKAYLCAERITSVNDINVCQTQYFNMPILVYITCLTSVQSRSKNMTVANMCHIIIQVYVKQSHVWLDRKPDHICMCGDQI